MLYAEELRNAIYIFLSNFAKFHEYVQFYLYGDQWSIKRISTTKKNLDEFNIDQSCFLFFHIWIKGI